MGAITIAGHTVKENVAFYIIAHASKFLRPGSTRVQSNYSSDLPNVAFKTPAGNIVVVVVNNTSINKAFNIKGSVEFMVCDDERCLPPTEIDLEFKVKKQ